MWPSFSGLRYTGGEGGRKGGRAGVHKGTAKRHGTARLGPPDRREWTVLHAASRHDLLFPLLDIDTTQPQRYQEM